jgi:hypothetical protein
LAGVLFGEGQGRTSGSYCGRVRWFLTSVVPASNQRPIVAQSAPQLQPVAPRPVELAAKAEPFRPAAAPIVQTSPQPDNVKNTMTAPGVVVASTRGEALPAPTVRTLGWEDLAGTTLGEQAKTVLAIVGVVALLLHALRWLGSQHAPA